MGLGLSLGVIRKIYFANFLEEMLLGFSSEGERC